MLTSVWYEQPTFGPVPFVVHSFSIIMTKQLFCQGAILVFRAQFEVLSDLVGKKVKKIAWDFPGPSEEEPAMFLTLAHLTIGKLAILSNGLAALWLWLLNYWQVPLNRGARLALYLAWSSLGLQSVLGLSMIFAGGVGTPLHYICALPAIFVSWQAWQYQRAKPANALGSLAWGCTLTWGLTLGAYLAGTMVRN